MENAMKQISRKTQEEDQGQAVATEVERSEGRKSDLVAAKVPERSEKTSPVECPLNFVQVTLGRACPNLSQLRASYMICITPCKMKYRQKESKKSSLLVSHSIMYWQPPKIAMFVHVCPRHLPPVARDFLHFLSDSFWTISPDLGLIPKTSQGA
jgi:hypothetical protein